jgi:hypothetical protein
MDSRVDLLTFASEAKAISRASIGSFGSELRWRLRAYIITWHDSLEILGRHLSAIVDFLMAQS